MAKQTVTNVTIGPRVLNAKPAITLAPGETVEGVEIDDAELENAKLTDWFAFGDPDPDAKPSLSGKNKADLLAIAEAEGVEIEEGATNDDIRAAIELARGE